MNVNMLLSKSVDVNAYLLDIYTAAESATSLRKLKTGAVNCCEIRRSSDDAATIIYLEDEGQISLSSTVSAGGTLASWIGSDDGFLRTWYDQSGNGNDFQQTDTSLQWQLISAGEFIIDSNGNIGFDNKSGDLPTNTDLSIGGNSTIFTVMESTDTQGVIYNQVGSLSYYAGAVQSGSSSNADGASGICSYYVDGVLITNTRDDLYTALCTGDLSILSTYIGDTANYTNLGITSYTSGSFDLAQKADEYIIFNSDESVNQSGIESNINDFYFPFKPYKFYRLQSVDVDGTENSESIMLSNWRLYTELNQGGTEYPTTNLTSNTSEVGVTASAGYIASETYDAWKAFNGVSGTNGWWTLSVSNADENWIQLEFDTDKTFKSVTLTIRTLFTDSASLKLMGSDTGVFGGEETFIKQIYNIDAGPSGDNIINLNLTSTPDFSPLDFSPNLWLDATDATTITETSGDVDQWDDKSGFGNNVSSGTDKPTNDGNINGFNAINWGSVPNSNQLDFSTGANTDNWQDVYFVGRWDGGTTFNSYCGLVTASVSGGTSNGIGVIGDSGNDYFYNNQKWHDNLYLNGVSISSLEAVLNTTNQLSDNFVLSFSADSAIGVDGLSIGMDRTGFAGRSWLGNIGEVIAFPRKLTDSERSRLMTYLNGKWAI